MGYDTCASECKCYYRCAIVYTAHDHDAVKTNFVVTFVPLSICMSVICPSHNSIVIQEALLLQRDHAVHYVSHNDKSDFQSHSRSLVFLPFDKPYMIFLLVFHCNYVYPAPFLRYCRLFPKNSRGNMTMTMPTM